MRSAVLRCWLAVAAVCLLAAGPAAATTVIDFEGFAHGTVLSTQIGGLTITVDNVGGGPDLGVIFNTAETGTSDADLEGPPNSSWAAGNLAPGTELNNILIIQENSTGCGDGVCDDPDDEGSRPAGTIQIDFDFNIDFDEFGYDHVDNEGTPSPEGTSITFALGGVNLATVNYAQYTNGSAFNVTGWVFGNHTANRVPVGTFSSLSGSFNRIIISMGGSGGIDNLVVPEPTTALLIGMGLLGMAAGARWRSRD